MSKASTESASSSTTETTMASSKAGESQTSTEESTATFTAQIELDQDEENDVRRVILDEYERCLAKHGANLNDLLKLHQRESQATKKLTLHLDEAKKKEAKERKKAEMLNKTVDDILKGVSEVTQQPMSPSENKAEALRQAVDEIRRQIDEFRRRKETLDRQIDQLKVQVEQNQLKLNKRQTSEAELTKMSGQIDQAKNEVNNLLRGLNQSLSLVNRRLQTDYQVNEDPESTDEVRAVLDKLLTDIVNLVSQHRSLMESIADLRMKIEENERHISHARNMNDFLTNEARKLLLIGNRKEAASIDPTDYDAVRKFVDQTFQDVIEQLKLQNREMADLAEARQKQDRTEQERKAELDRELAVKQAKIDSTRDMLNKLNAQNEFLRQQLLKEQSPAASEADTELIKNIKVVQEAQDKNQNAALEAQLQQSRARNEESRKQLNELTTAINEADEKLGRKRRELQSLSDKADADREANRQKLSDLEKKIAETSREIESRERDLVELTSKSEEAKQLKDEIEKLARLEKDLMEKVSDMEKQLQEAEEERAKLGTDLNKQIDECNALRARLRNEDMRREALEDKLNEIKEKISDTDKRLERERERTYVIERDVSAAAIGKTVKNTTPVYQHQGSGLQQGQSVPIAYQQRGPSLLSSSKPPVASRRPGTLELDERIRNLEQNRDRSANRNDRLRRQVDQMKTQASSNVKESLRSQTASSKATSAGGGATSSEQQYNVSGKINVEIDDRTNHQDVPQSNQ